MIAKALNFCTKLIKLDETSFNTPFGIKMCKKPIFSRFYLTNVWSNRAKTLYLVPRMLPRVFGLTIAHLALSQHLDGIIQKSQIVLFVNIKVKVRSGCVSDRKNAQLH